MATIQPTRFRNPRRHLSADALNDSLRQRFGTITDPRPSGTISLSDALMSAFAMFSLKDRSLLVFDGRRNDKNLKRIYGIERIPCDTQMREILDPLDPDLLRPCFSDVFRSLQRGKVLKRFRFYKGCYLLSLDGTGYFSSQNIHCNSCQKKVNQKTGAVTYQHQMLGAVLMHPDRKEVIPLAPEPIQKHDGNNKNDCERNAAKRLLRKTREDHPYLKLIVTEDGLASNGPHLRELKRQKMHFLVVAKPGDHPYLFDQVIRAFEEDRVATSSWQAGERECQVAFLNNVPLNATNSDLLVNFLQYAECDAAGRQQKFRTWITDLQIRHANVALLVRGGLCRWKIENETYNTMKNQGYHFEHNFGHGKQHLCVVFAMLMMLAFLVDQVQQLCNPTFNAACARVGTKRNLWDNVRSHFRHFTFRSMQQLYEVIVTGCAKEVPLPQSAPYLQYDTF